MLTIRGERPCPDSPDGDRPVRAATPSPPGDTSELSVVDQHPGDYATELFDAELDQSLAERAANWPEHRLAPPVRHLGRAAESA
jgi:hypothetical protein